MHSTRASTCLCLIFCAFFGVSACRTGKPVTQVDRVDVFEKFTPAGSTIGLLNQFYRPSSNVDTTISKTIGVTASDLIGSLKSARHFRHHQQKIAGVTLAGKFFAEGRPHCFIYLKTGPAVIDLTDRETYLLTDTLKITMR